MCLNLLKWMDGDVIVMSITITFLSLFPSSLINRLVLFFFLFFFFLFHFFILLL